MKCVSKYINRTYIISANVHGSLKKRVAPLPPPAGAGTMQLQPNQYGTLPSSHTRTPSDPISAGYHTLSHTHKRSPSSDSTSGRSVIHLGKSQVKIYLYYFDK